MEAKEKCHLKRIKGRYLSTLVNLTTKENSDPRKMRVKICGRYVYNYPGERAISRGGWLQFYLISKDSRLYDAIKLCRHWDEFYDLNIVANFQYFQAAKWLIWKGDRFQQQLLQFVRLLSSRVSSPTNAEIYRVSYLTKSIEMPRNTRKISGRGHAISSFGAPIKLSKLVTLCAPMSSVTTQRYVAFSNTRQCILFVLLLSSEMLRLAGFLRNRPRTKRG